MSKHARLSPSSAKRWMNCAGSVRLIGDEPNSAGTPAMLGTAAHKVIETMVDSGETDASAYHGRIVVVEKAGNEETLIFRSDDPEAMKPREGFFAFVVDDAMVYGVQTMIDEIERIRDTLWEPDTYSERYLDMSWLDPRLGGTADVTLVEPAGWIHLLDYKNGRVVVEVQDNEQLKNYGVGLLHEHPDCIGVVIHLVQPNARHEDGIVREASYTADELKLFEIQMKEAADATSAPNAPFRAGDWCTYCPARNRCETFDALALEQAGMDFTDDPVEPEVAGNELVAMEQDAPGAAEAYLAELARRARWIPVIDSWARGLRAAIQAELLSGAVVPGWKLVRGRANRKWPDDTRRVEDVLVEEGDLAVSLLYTEPALKSPAQIEKLGIGAEHKAKVKALVAGLAIKPEGRLAIAPAADVRPAIDARSLAAEDFVDDPLEEPVP